MNTIWRNDEEGHSVLLRITPVGLDAINVDRQPTGAEGPALAAAAYRFNAGPNSAGESAARESTATDTALAKAPAKKPATMGADAATTRTTRDGSKQARLIAMLRRKEGATIAQIVEATGWQPHTVRGAFAGALKKRLGLSVTSEKVEGVRVYRIDA